jgi:hypothetical protein
VRIGAMVAHDVFRAYREPLRFFGRLFFHFSERIDNPCVFIYMSTSSVDISGLMFIFKNQAAINQPKIKKTGVFHARKPKVHFFTSHGCSGGK